MSDLHLHVRTRNENTMKEIPILFNGEMVRAILEGRKTQTRRPIDMRRLKGVLPRVVHGDWMSSNIEAKAGIHQLSVNPQFAVCAADAVDFSNPKGARHNLGLRPREFNFICPTVGGECETDCIDNVWHLRPREATILWVRETWRAYQLTEEEGIQFRADGAFQPLPDEMEEGELLQYQNAENYDDDPPNHGPWRPSIHMPRWASRIQLRVKSVRIQRVQDISERDAWKEGCEKGDRADNGSYFPKLVPILNKQGEHVCDQGFDDAHEWFAWNWNRIYGEANFDEVNPWVWAIEFERINPLNP